MELLYICLQKKFSYDSITSEKVDQIFQLHRPQGKADLAPVCQHATAQSFIRQLFLLSLLILNMIFYYSLIFY